MSRSPTAWLLLLALGAGACAKVNMGPGGAGGGGGVPTGEGGRRDAGITPDTGRREGGINDDAVSCRNLQCRQMLCPNDGHTTLTGTVYAPNGKLPIYNAVVYVPNAAVPAIPTGLTCDQCGAIPPGEPLVSALTDAHGVFTLNDVPTGDGVPLVIQVGKWRRQVAVSGVMPCKANTITDANLTRLPRNHTEGDMPRIAITTGPCDNLVCLMPKLGIDASEWGIAGENKTVTFFHGATYDTDGTALPRLFDSHLAAMTSATALWASLTELKKYDLLIDACECQEVPATAAQYSAVTQYLAMGGRMFSTDLQYIWYKNSSDANLRNSVQTVSGNLTPGLSPLDLDITFPKGKAFADWMSYVNPADAYGQVSCDQVWDNFTGVSRPAWQTWATSESMAGGNSHPRFLTVNTPVGVPLDKQCGRAVHLDAHVSPALGDRFPAACGAELESGEQALVFFLFDVAACIQDDTKPPVPPPPIIP